MDAEQIVSKPGVVEEFVDNSQVEETDALMDGLIAEVEQEFGDEDLAGLPDETAEGAGDEEPVVTEEETPEDDRSVERLVAREVELRTKEEALRSREAQVKAVEEENTQLRAQLTDLQARIPEDFIDQLRVNPWETLESVGYDPEHVVRVVLAQKLAKQGKEVPKELRDEIRAAELDYKYQLQEKKLQQIEQNRKAAEFVAKVESDARQYIHAMTELKPEFSKDAPTVAKVAKADPERVFAEIMDEISRDANARRREPNAALISYAEAARRVEKRWADMKRFLADAPTNASTTAAETNGTSAATGASAKKVIKPLTPAKPKTQEELEKEGLEAALAEYKRVELARKKGNQPLRK